MKVIILGASGMLGSMLLDYFAKDVSFQLIATVRNRELIQKFQPFISNIEWRLLNAERCSLDEIVDVLDDASWVINAIGVIKPYIHDGNAAEVERAVIVNALFPHQLARAAEKTACRVLQIATDCVFSGNKGYYTEKDSHDPLDVYGKTKSIGEVYAAHVYHIRCSIIGPEPKGHVSLMDWFLRQPCSSRVNGYTNHQWNGITTLHFARICQGIIKQDIKLPHVQHLIPADTISKAALLQSFAREYHREDVKITPTKATTVIDRTLSTINKSLNQQLWAAAGYDQSPSVQQMVAELARFNYRFSWDSSK